jgi:SAM-dependent methyltransferase
VACAQTEQAVRCELARRCVCLASAAGLLTLVLWLLNWLSYRVLNGRILRRRTWDLNICCGKTDGGGVNVDIVRHAELPNLVLVDDIYRLPFKAGQFGTVLCSHTMEHVERPLEFYRELGRVGRVVTVVVPPLWDLSAAFNLFEHKWIFASLKTEHRELPRHVRMPLVSSLHRRFGQRIRA